MSCVAAFPDGWMNSGQISRDGTSPYLATLNMVADDYIVSVIKKKFETAMKEDDV